MGQFTGVLANDAWAQATLYFTVLTLTKKMQSNIPSKSAGATPASVKN